MTKKTRRKTTPKKNIYQSVTDTVIELLENHLEDWKRPWIAFGQDGDYSRNASTSNYYRGVNQFLLSFIMLRKGFLKNQWLTFKQAKDMGGTVKKGEKGSPIIFYKTAYIDEKGKYYAKDTFNSMNEGQRDSLGIQQIPMLKQYIVFNVTQTEGLAEQFYQVSATEPLQDFAQDERAEQLIRATGANIEVTQSNKAAYNHVTDKITMPLREQFRGATERFYATALHELGHWTGHKKRLNREFGKAFGDTEYAKEELIAELSSAYCCAALGFEKPITDSAAYLKSWIGILKEDNRAIIRAAAQAQRAADYILKGTQWEVQRNEI